MFAVTGSPLCLMFGAADAGDGRSTRTSRAGAAGGRAPPRRPRRDFGARARRQPWRAARSARARTRSTRRDAAPRRRDAARRAAELRPAAVGAPPRRRRLPRAAARRRRPARRTSQRRASRRGGDDALRERRDRPARGRRATLPASPSPRRWTAARSGSPARRADVARRRPLAGRAGGDAPLPGASVEIAVAVLAEAGGRLGLAQVAARTCARDELVRRRRARPRALLAAVAETGPARCSSWSTATWGSSRALLSRPPLRGRRRRGVARRGASRDAARRVHVRSPSWTPTSRALRADRRALAARQLDDVAAEAIARDWPPRKSRRLLAPVARRGRARAGAARSPPRCRCSTCSACPSRRAAAVADRWAAHRRRPARADRPSRPTAPFEVDAGRTEGLRMLLARHAGRRQERAAADA